MVGELGRHFEKIDKLIGGKSDTLGGEVTKLGLKWSKSTSEPDAILGIDEKLSPGTGFGNFPSGAVQKSFDQSENALQIGGVATRSQRHLLNFYSVHEQTHRDKTLTYTSIQERNIRVSIYTHPYTQFAEENAISIILAREDPRKNVNKSNGN